MGIKRIVDVSFWTDEKSLEIFSPEDKYFMLYLLTNPHTTQLGIYKYNVALMAFELGYSKESVSVLLDRFETKYKIIYRSKSTNELAVKNYLRYSIVKGGKPVEDLLNKELGNIKDKDLIKKVFSKLIGQDNLNETIKKIINENYNDNDNDNDNDNEESLHDSINDTCNDSLKTTPKKPPKQNNKMIDENIINDYTNDSELKEIIRKFIDHRKSVCKKPLTSNSLKLTLDKLDKLSSNTATKIEILNESIMNGWQGIFPLKNQNQNNNEHPYRKVSNGNVFLEILNGGGNSDY